MRKRPKVIAITGAESTGKSTLASALSSHYDASVIPEFARSYVKNLKRPYQFEDLELIAKKQIEQLESQINKESNLLILDTWLIITLVWFEVVYQNTPSWLIEALKEIHIDLYLICDIDLPWIDDPVRENGGKRRAELQHRYVDLINQFGFPYKIVSGQGQERTSCAIKHIEEFRFAQQD